MSYNPEGDEKQHADENTSLYLDPPLSKEGFGSHLNRYMGFEDDLEITEEPSLGSAYSTVNTTSATKSVPIRHGSAYAGLQAEESSSDSDEQSSDNEEEDSSSDDRFSWSEGVLVSAHSRSLLNSNQKTSSSSFTPTMLLSTLGNEPHDNKDPHRTEKTTHQGNNKEPKEKEKERTAHDSSSDDDLVHNSDSESDDDDYIPVGPPTSSSSSEQKNWNERFQQLLEQDDSPTKYQKLHELISEFVETASKYGRIIISELFLEDEERTIKQARVGGIAGGVKYMVKGIFFKLAQDTKIAPGQWMYGGETCSDENAIKAAGHELRSVGQVLNAFVPGLHVPLTCTVDYQGFRLLCSSMVPINDQTLCYGSPDGGKTVQNSCPELRRKIKKLCKWLGLNKHIITGNQALYGPGDLEGHKSTKDDRCYLLDLARLFPPEAPSSTSPKRSIFYRLLRPEFVRSYTRLVNIPLCSDAFTRWASQDPNFDNMNKDVIEATRRLHTEGIPKLAQQLENIFKLPSVSHDIVYHAGVVHPRLKFDMLQGAVVSKNMLLKDDPIYRYDVDLPFIFHQAGVNIRHMGRVRLHVKNEPNVRQVLLIEMVARIFKNELREQLRQKMKELKTSSDNPFLDIIINFINTLTRNQPARVSETREIIPAIDLRPTAWMAFVTDKLVSKFGCRLESSDELALMTLPLAPVLKSFCRMMNIKLRRHVFHCMKSDNIPAASSANSYIQIVANKSIPYITSRDIVQVGTVMKHMPVKYWAEGAAARFEAMKCYDHSPKAAEALLESATYNIQLASSIGINNYAITLNEGIVRRQLLALYRIRSECSISPLSAIRLDKSHQMVQLYDHSVARFVRTLDFIADKGNDAIEAQVRYEYALCLFDGFRQWKEAMNELTTALVPSATV